MGPNEPFAAKMLRTTMDVDCPEWFDWFHGGLQYQAVHHLFPRLPRHNLRECVPLVRQFCKEVGLHYYMYNFSTGNGVVLGGMKTVADQVKFMNEVAKSNADIWANNKHL
jgi:delta8-fatty-acid desaturase